jgi:hypothetical protein
MKEIIVTFEGKIEVRLAWRELPVWLYVTASEIGVSVTDPVHSPRKPATYDGNGWNRPLADVFAGACCQLCFAVQDCFEVMLAACCDELMTQEMMVARCAEIARVTEIVTRALEGNKLADTYI